MDRLIYTSLTAMRSSQARQTATANNLANAETPGFRADVAEAQTLWLNGHNLDSRAMASEEVIAADMRTGTVVDTGRPLDISVSGDAMLAVQAPNGETGYTRRGDLQITETGLLTTGDGRPVLGGAGPITLPPADDITIDAEGRLMVVPLGGDPDQPEEVDRLTIASPAGSDIVKGVDGLFRVRGGGVLPADPDGRVTAGSLERSNVSTTFALVEMIEASRSWDRQLEMMSNVRDMDAATADLMRMDN